MHLLWFLFKKKKKGQREKKSLSEIMLYRRIRSLGPVCILYESPRRAAGLFLALEGAVMSPTAAAGVGVRGFWCARTGFSS